MPTQLPNTQGHYPAGYPRGQGAGAGGNSYDPGRLEKATEKPDLQVFKSAIADAQNTSLAADYYSRNLCSRDWWYSRWSYQTVDGRKWGYPQGGIQPWPWPGASDTRVRTVEKVIGQHRKIDTNALRNLKIQPKSDKTAMLIKT